MDIKEQVGKMDSLVAKGAIIDAVKTFFAENISTSDYGDATTTNKAQKLEKLEVFLGSIANVNGIIHHHTIV